METKINYINADFKNAKNKCRVTVGKSPSSIEPTEEFNIKLLISEHSPIRLLTVDWSWTGIKSWVATHWSRHKWECFISTQRTDRTGIDRDQLKQDEPVNFDGNANAQHLIDTMRKRLCYLCSGETRILAESLKIELTQHNKALGDVLVPNCVYRCGCPEFTSCGMFERMGASQPDIRDRYDNYNKWFSGRQGDEV